MTTNAPQGEPTDKTNKVLVSVVLDRSGSMGSCQAQTIDGYNEYLNALRTDKESEYNITLIQFDHGPNGCDLTVCYVDKPLAEVPNLTKETYQPRGRTPLYDAIGECIRRTEAKGRAVINVIITDGNENDSQEFTLDTIRALVKEKEAEKQTFVFLGANIDAFAVGSSFGAQPKNISNYNTTASGAAFANTARSTIMRAASARTEGLAFSVTADFYSDEQRVSNMGGQPTAPATFPKAAKVDRKSRKWNTTTA